MLSQDYLQDDFKVGQFRRVSELANVSNGRVCVLYPYQPYIAESDPESARINAYLKSSGYSADESHWAIVIIELNGITLSKFKRSEMFDILAKHEIHPEHSVKLPKRFSPANCASLGTAVLAKIELQDRIFFVLGEIK